VRRRDLIADLQDAPVTPLALAGVVVLVVLAASSAGYPVTAWGPGGLVVLGLLLLALLVLPHQLQAVPRPTLVAGGLLAGYVLWSYLTIVWADDQGAAWTGANRTLVYLAVFCLFALWPQRGRTAAVILGPWVLALAGLAGYEAVRVATASTPTALFVDGRLLAPSGYPNANAALWLMAFWPALGLASARELAPALRGLFAAAAVVLADVALLSQSRGSIIATPILLVLTLIVLPWPRATLMTILPVGAAVGASVPALLDVRDRVLARGTWHHGFLATAPRVVLIGAVACGAAVAAAALTMERRGHLADRRPRLPSWWPGALAGLAAVVLVVAVVDPGGTLDSAWHSFKKGSPVTGEQGRLQSGLGSNRYDFYRVALNVFADHPIGGAGVDNFAADYLVHGRSAETPRYPHSLELRTLSETGVIGFVLLFGALAAALFAGLRAAWRAPPLRATVAASAVLGAAYWIVHGSFDWFFEFGGLGAAAFALLGLGCACAQAPEIWHRARPPLSRLPFAIAGLVVAVGLGVALALPWLAERDVVAAAKAWPRDTGAAYAQLHRAAGLDPLSDRAYLVEGSIAARLGDFGRARAAFVHALQRVPRGSYAHLQLGAMSAQRHHRGAALVQLRRAHALAPRDPVIAAALRRVRTGAPLTVALVDAALLGRTS
jgi:hypothetical protein